MSEVLEKILSELEESGMNKEIAEKAMNTLRIGISKYQNIVHSLNLATWVLKGNKLSKEETYKSLLAVKKSMEAQNERIERNLENKKAHSQQNY